MENQETILTMYCVKEIENNYFKWFTSLWSVFVPTNAKLTVKLNLFYR